MTLNIQHPSDWHQLPAHKLSTVLDPMVLRTGELFLRGAANAREASEQVWTLLSANTMALGTFFDALILNERLPIFNYGDTFDMHLNFDGHLFSRINEREQVFYEINVGYSAYREVKSAALDELASAIEGPGRIPRSMGEEILAELSAAEYHWNPHLEHLESRVAGADERRLAAFLLGGLIFAGYAQQIEGEQLLQPKRSRIFLALSLGEESTSHTLEEKLFGELKKRANVAAEDLPWMPTFFPYLLSRANSPDALLAEVFRLRGSAEVRDYRQWLGEVMEDFRRNGKIGVERTKDVRAIERAVDTMLGTIPSAPKVEMKWTLADLIAHTLPVSVDMTPVIERLWGWSLASVPGKRYRKLLARAVVADHEYGRIESRVKTVWKT